MEKYTGNEEGLTKEEETELGEAYSNNPCIKLLGICCTLSGYPAFCPPVPICFWMLDNLGH